MLMQMHINIYIHAYKDICSSMHILTYLMTNLYMISEAKAQRSIQINHP